MNIYMKHLYFFIFISVSIGCFSMEKDSLFDLEYPRYVPKKDSSDEEYASQESGSSDSESEDQIALQLINPKKEKFPFSLLIDESPLSEDVKTLCSTSNNVKILNLYKRKVYQDQQSSWTKQKVQSGWNSIKALTARLANDFQYSGKSYMNIPYLASGCNINADHNSKKLFTYHIKNNNTRWVNYFIKHGIDLNCPYKPNKYYWHIPLKTDNQELFECIYPGLNDENKVEACVQSIQLNKWRFVQQCVEHNVNVDQVAEKPLASSEPRFKGNILKYIIYYNKERIASLLFPYLNDENKKYALKKSFVYNNPSLAKICLEDKPAFFAQALLALYDSESYPLNCLRAWNTIINNQVKKQQYTNKKREWEALKIQYNNNAQYEFIQKSDYNLIDYHQENSLLEAIRLRNIKGIQTCLYTGINPNGKDSDGVHYWRHAFTTNDADIFEFFYPQLSTQNALEALYFSIVNNKPHMLRICIKHGANVNSVCDDITELTLPNNKLMNVIQYIIYCQHSKTAKIIIPHLSQENQAAYFKECFTLNAPSMVSQFINHASYGYCGQHDILIKEFCRERALAVSDDLETNLKNLIDSYDFNVRKTEWEKLIREFPLTTHIF